MRLTTRGKLAVTALTDLALHSGGQPVALPAISARQSISLSHLEDIFSALRRAGLVASSRGPGGGYRLTCPPQTLTVAQIIQAAEAALPAPRPRRPQHAANTDMTAELWSSFQGRVMDYLQSVTLADLLAQQPRASVSVASRRGASRTRPVRQIPAQDVPNSVFALGLTPS
ncbi:Fe-S cluster assembly transcriptional regulator IscR [Melaminivora jejuensis]|uniref:Rrf2 family transcriptional regulator n=1 Tax=Melaminivora jejuensis TaxID=1267217 RepID=UPI001E5E518B|nr:Rrf2 family transcriptional regulator [Melaminivora jejuensis]UHJ63846.1 Rrf2 family transcriptional regulator [Melaminivora jejuensis]